MQSLGWETMLYLSTISPSLKTLNKTRNFWEQIIELPNSLIPIQGVVNKYTQQSTMVGTHMKEALIEMFPLMYIAMHSDCS